MEEEVARRVEALVAQRVEEELEKRKDEIEAEVLRRVEEAKKIMESQMLEELELKRQNELALQKKKEVKFAALIVRDAISSLDWSFGCLLTIILFQENWFLEGLQCDSFYHYQLGDINVLLAFLV